MLYARMPAFALGILTALPAMVVCNADTSAGPAIGQFEIKSLKAEPGRVELQSQNAFSFGNPRRRTTDVGGEIEADDNSIASVRAALEIEYTFSRFFKGRIGIEYEKERLDDFSSLSEANSFDRLRLDEYEVEGIIVFLSRPKQGFGLGLLVEYEHSAEADGARTLNYGPIIEWVSGPWLATFNPSLISFFGGERNEHGKHDEKIDFRYAARLMYRAADDLSLAIEAYGTIERIGGTGSPGEEALLFGDFNQHRIGPVVYWSHELNGGFARGKDGETELTIGLGMLAGLNRSTPDATLKLSVELEF